MPGKLFGYGAFAQIKDLLPAIISSAIMLIILVLTTSGINNDLVKMIVSFVIGAISYLVVSSLLKVEEIKVIRSLIINNYKKTLIHN